MEEKMEVKNEEGMEELLRQILEADKNEVKYAKRAAFFMMGLFVVFLVAAIIVIPKVVETLSNVNTAVVSAGETLKGADDAIENINKMSDSITKTSDNMNSMLTDNSESLTAAVEKMNSIDFEGLNSAITDLQDAVGPFADFMNRFK
ncbi:MAG: hypothetical protein IJV16_03560 [Lachnospiraceae bacterium]|nr:hypothetical protein [Lachnospiraceae bacterium]MBR1524396.1 hypothetical protein [Lachnospiraceae bacterium]